MLCKWFDLLIYTHRGCHVGTQEKEMEWRRRGREKARGQQNRLAGFTGSRIGVCPERGVLWRSAVTHGHPGLRTLWFKRMSLFIKMGNLHHLGSRVNVYSWTDPGHTRPYREQISS